MEAWFRNLSQTVQKQLVSLMHESRQILTSKGRDVGMFNKLVDALDNVYHENKIGQLQSDDKDRAHLFKLMSRFTVDLILAEEAYLKAGGWKLVEIRGTHSTWSYPRYPGMAYSRTHAVLISKSEDLNVGIH